MGVSLIQSVQVLTMIKLTLLASFAALAAGSADADAFYGGYGYPYAHGYHAYVPFGSSTGLDPITQGLDPVTQGHVPYYGNPYAAYAYGYPYAHAYVPFGSSTGLDPITQGLDPATQGYLPYGYYHHY